VRQGAEMREYTITPEEVGLTRVSNRQALQGGDPAYNATLLRQLLSEQDAGPATDMLCLNTGAALFANEQVDSLIEGIKLARATLREGKAKRKLDEVIACSNAHH
ncbi:MAG: anthranilate phosphoribosyltransferase, partial [Ktedonobacteraceae bacterium]